MDIPKTIQTLRYENDKDKRLIQSLQFEFRAKLGHELTSTSDNGEYTPYSEQFIEYDISTEEKCKDLLNSVLSSPISINSFLSICQDIEKQYPSLIYDLDSTLIKLSESENTISKLKILQKYIENDTRKTEANLNLKKIKSIPASNELSAICSDKSFIPLYKFDDNFNNGDDECLLILFNDLHFVFNNTKHEIKYCKSLNSKEISTIKYSDILDENKGDVYCLNNIKTKLYITQIKNDEMTVTIFPKGFVSKNTMKNEFSIKLKGNVDTSAKIDRNPFNENIKVFYEDGTSQNIDLTIKKIGPDDKLYSDSIFVTKAYYEDSNKVLYTHSFCSFENNLHFTKQKF
ncbi:hypothetical protein TVAG_428700 [Trichomonas vaginalis G3]|uniref:Uncharacterized protein n=1 Tax=Trichomonas vaginalis (strain ATCC PRA-98 / G3) TaxID=412133 RepID=A2FJ60_TRIV3|nr:hypothetical protein TVAGG3_0914620 [Trichomonas vaginalis G3]EAX95067.1 hypothetical protein TVAG_428700 [Trichomonas vaginalis G3]KAI5484691.1 hypothetical protein TVAGG3_0914620 [Trichomonas vaginalis G3]|eukprot:XP_001307997.1 hypothetical protein [Trichomonas vaginalis G3]